MKLAILNDYFNNGLLLKQTHPLLPLTIWNYSQKVQYESLWDAVTTKCRGLVTDETGRVVGRGWRKFFNLSENRHVPTDEFKVYDKEDGSLILAFQYKGTWVISSRGSFTSKQAIAASDLFYDLGHDKALSGNEGVTYLFEYVSDWNRVVVKYDRERLILLGAVNNDNGGDINIDALRSDFFQNVHKIDIVKQYHGIRDYNTLKSIIPNDAEGFVIVFSNGDRAKIKGEEYLRLHKIMTSVSTKSVWNILYKNGSVSELLENTPDEFYEKIKEYETELRNEHATILSNYSLIFDRLVSLVCCDRKIFAEEAKKYKYPGILFSMLDGKNVDSIIWGILKPKFAKI